MDLVSRLRKYIEHSGQAVTQFADSCNIPRPTMSQLLSGRNKKVSNELIAKIHDAYPDLNVLWLMFGQGDMLVEENIAVSERQNGPNQDMLQAQSAERKKIGEVVLHFDSPSFDDSDNLFDDNSRDDGVETGEPDESAPFSPASENEIEAPSVFAAPGNASADNKTSGGSIEMIKKVAGATSAGKRIVNIIVYYSDNSFESFVPERL